MNIKSKFTILVATIVSLSFGLVSASLSDGHGHGMNVPKIEVTTVLEGLENPSSENLCLWIWERLVPSLPGLSQIEIKETDSTGCIYKGE